MTYQEKYEQLIERFIERKSLSIAIMQKEAKVGIRLAGKVYEEWKNYHDEIYWHNAIYEMSFMNEVVTPTRIMNEFGVSYYFAKKLFDYYLEQI